MNLDDETLLTAIPRRASSTPPAAIGSRPPRWRARGLARNRLRDLAEASATWSRACRPFAPQAVVRRIRRRPRSHRIAAPSLGVSVRVSRGGLAPLAGRRLPGPCGRGELVDHDQPDAVRSRRSRSQRSESKIESQRLSVKSASSPPELFIGGLAVKRDAAQSARQPRRRQRVEVASSRSCRLGRGIWSFEGSRAAARASRSRRRPQDPRARPSIVWATKNCANWNWPSSERIASIPRTARSPSRPASSSIRSRLRAPSSAPSTWMTTNGMCSRATSVTRSGRLASRRPPLRPRSCSWPIKESRQVRRAVRDIDFASD